MKRRGDYRGEEGEPGFCFDAALLRGPLGPNQNPPLLRPSAGMRDPRAGREEEEEEDGGRSLMAGVMISFTNTGTLPVAPQPRRQHTHTILRLTQTHTHTMVRPPIKSKVVCFYWSFALTSGLSF